jgi:hypothetical protein
MRISTLLICSVLVLLVTGCNRDKTPPTISVTEPAYDGKNVQFGDVFFVEFEAIDDAEDGGLWRVELRGADGITPKTAQAGLWAGASTGNLILAFALDASSWPTGPMTLAVVADDAAGNRAAVFRDLNYTAAEDLPEVVVALTAEADGSSTLVRTDANGGELADWTGLPGSAKLTYSDGVIALADIADATVHLVDWATGEVTNVWTDPTVAGAAPHIKALHPLGVQAGFIVAHSGGVVAIDPSGNLLFERFSEAPWVPIDVRFDGTTCVAWERNEATDNHRLRSWDFQTGGTGPIVALANAPDGWAVVGQQDGGTPGNVCMLSESDGITLVNTATGELSDLCPLLGSGSMGLAPYGAVGIDGSEALFLRGEFLCRQSMAPVASGSQWPVEGTLQSMRALESGGVEFTRVVAGGLELWRWDAVGTAPELAVMVPAVNTLDVVIVNE